MQKKPISTVWLILSLALLAALAAAALLLPAGQEAHSAQIYLHGELLLSIDLDGLTEPLELPVGDGNVVRAERGRIRMLEADCPDGLCVRQGWTSSPARPVVCLPNGVTIAVSGGDASEPDAALR